MAILASLDRTVKAGLSVWDFCEEDGVYFARNNFGKHIPCKDVEDLRTFYKRMLNYGFRPASDVTPAP